MDKYHDIEVEDNLTGFYRFRNGVTEIFITTRVETPGRNRGEIIEGKRANAFCEQ